jgi:hypothetical protein
MRTTRSTSAPPKTAATGLDPWRFIGRHTWGGSKTNNQSWGVEGGLVADLVAEDRLFYADLDSRYTSGWG